MAYDYEKLLKRARALIPEVAQKQERLELPMLRMQVIGMRTVVGNFRDIANALNRDQQHILKFLTSEMATAATSQGDRVIFQGKFSADTLKKLLQRYTDNFVVCPICGRPDTRIVKERRLSFLKCDACGAKSAIKQL